MGKKDRKQLLEFLKPFDRETIDTVMWLRDFAWDLLPQTNELIYDNYNAVAFGWSVTERLGQTTCSVAVIRSNQNIHFGFYRGNQISDPEKILKGKGNQYRYVLVKDKNEFPKAYISSLVKQAYINAMLSVKNEAEIASGKTLVKSVSEKKRLPAKKSLKPS
jgi:hypothetical protein